jgi:hypothetical protein
MRNLMRSLWRVFHSSGALPKSNMGSPIKVFAPTRLQAPRGRGGAFYGRPSVTPGARRLLTRGLRLDPLARKGGADEHLPSTA